MLLLKWQKGRQPRRLLCFSAAFFLIVLLFSLVFTREDSLVNTILLCGAAALGLSALAVFLLREDFPPFLPLLAGFLVGWLWCSGYAWFVWQPTQLYDGRQTAVRLELTEYAEGRTGYGIAYGVVTERDGEPCHLKVKAYLSDGSPAFAPGDVLCFDGTFRAAERDWSRNLLQEGYFLTLSQDSDVQVFPGEAITLLRRMRIFSHQITERIGMLLPGDEGALLSALLSGDRSGFSDEFDRALTISGTRHITAVSGLHVSILAGILMRLLGKRMGLLAAVPFAAVYAAIVGFSPSVVRAAILLVFWAASFWLKQEKDSLTSLAAALLLLIAWNPFSCMSAGLLLSFAASLGLMLLSAPLNDVLLKPLDHVKYPLANRLLRYVFSTTAATLAATLFTMPLNILFFETVPLFSLLSNLLILWAVTLTMALGIAVLLISPALPVAAAKLAQGLLYWPLWWMVKVIKWIGSLQFAAIDSANLILALVCLALLTALLLWKGRLLSGKRMLAAAGMLLCFVTAFTVAERMRYGIVEIENSGGQPVILVRGEGLSLLNSGMEYDLAAEKVQSAMTRWNIAQLDTVLCTSADYKTQSGLPAVLAQTEAQRILLPTDTGMVSSPFKGYTVSGFAESGTLTVSGMTVQLLRGGKETFALRLLGDRFSLLSLCGLKPTQAVDVTVNNLCSADILLVDDRLANDWQTLYDLCESVRPQQILITSAGYSEHGESFGGIPVTLIDWKGVQFRFTR